MIPAWHVVLTLYMISNTGCRLVIEDRWCTFWHPSVTLVDGKAGRMVKSQKPVAGGRTFGEIQDRLDTVVSPRYRQRNSGKILYIYHNVGRGYEMASAASSYADSSGKHAMP